MPSLTRPNLKCPRHSQPCNPPMPLTYHLPRRVRITQSQPSVTTTHLAQPDHHQPVSQVRHGRAYPSIDRYQADVRPTSKCFFGRLSCPICPSNVRFAPSPHISQINHPPSPITCQYVKCLPVTLVILRLRVSREDIHLPSHVIPPTPKRTPSVSKIRAVGPRGVRNGYSSAAQ